MFCAVAFGSQESSLLAVSAFDEINNLLKILIISFQAVSHLQAIGLS